VPVPKQVVEVVVDNVDVVVRHVGLVDPTVDVVDADAVNLMMMMTMTGRSDLRRLDDDEDDDNDHALAVTKPLSKQSSLSTAQFGPVST
jgi:hypothetical protein